ncbi:hypothetical protein ACFL54_08940, partial [Planctomycetota bacterium]
PGGSMRKAILCGMITLLMLTLPACKEETNNSPSSRQSSLAVQNHVLNAIMTGTVRGKVSSASLWLQDLQGLAVTFYNSSGSAFTFYLAGSDVTKLADKAKNRCRPLPDSHPFDQCRIQLDFVIKTRIADNFDRSPQPGMTFDFEAGEEGIIAAVEGRTLGIFLPSDMLTMGAFSGRSISQKKVRSVLLQRAGLRKFDMDNTDFIYFRSRTYLQDKPGSNQLLQMFRGNVLPEPPDVEDILTACIEAGRYFDRTVNKDGKFAYYYFPRTDKISNKGYNHLRHAGSAYSVFQLYGQTADDEVLATGDRALKYILRFVPARPSGLEYRYLLDHPRKNRPSKVKLGGAGLLLLALCEREKHTLDKCYRGLMSDLVSFIVRMQKENGDYYAKYNPEKHEPIPDSFSIYYPGEAALGLVEFFKLTGDKRALDSAHRALRFMCSEEHKAHDDYQASVGRSQYPNNLLIDSWRMMAYRLVWELTDDTSLAEECLLLADAMIIHQYQEESGCASDFVGGPKFPWPKVIASGSRKEGLTAAWHVAKKMDRNHERILKAIAESTRFCLNQQYRPENSYFLKNKTGLGGIRTGLLTDAIRNDSVQHNLSGMLAYYSILKSLENN